MPRTSKQWLEKSIWNKINKTLIEVTSSFEEKDLRLFLSEFLTKEERTMLAKRLHLYLLLIGGSGDKEIEEVLKVSNETIRTTRHSLGSKSANFGRLLKPFVKGTPKTRVKNQLVNTIDLALSAKSDKKARTKLLSGDY